MFFITRPNQLVNVEEIIEFLDHDSSSFYTAQHVYVFIIRLRAKIEVNPKKPSLLINLRPGYILNIKEQL